MTVFFISLIFEFACPNRDLTRILAVDYLFKDPSVNLAPLDPFLEPGAPFLDPIVAFLKPLLILLVPIDLLRSSSGDP